MENSEIVFEDIEFIKTKLYSFSELYEYCFILDSNGGNTALDTGRYEFLCALGAKQQYRGNTSEKLNEAERSEFWKFLYLNYGDPQNTVSSVIEPEVVFIIPKQSNRLYITNNGIDAGKYRSILNAFIAFETGALENSSLKIEFVPSTSKADYCQTVDKIREDIINGKYYEMNYCIEFSSDIKDSHFLSSYLKLNSQSKAPFAAFVRTDDHVLLCSSPERFLYRNKRQLVSQPIKGTNKRLNGQENESQLSALSNSEKERAENVMIVDLVRNDLARVCEYGSIRVDELFGTYAFPTLNHLISTVSGIQRDNISMNDILNSLFPMGSMTGAPKLEVMKHIDLYEHDPRGVYSGCLGYISPDSDFDLNVVIRTLVYDRRKGKIAYKVGSAITYDSVPESEYEECLLKGLRMASIFET